MERPYDVVTFDCYGTLIDWEGGITGAFARQAKAAGKSVDPQAVLAAYAEIEPVVEAETYRSYRAVLAETARRVAARLDLPLAEPFGEFLAESLPSWTPFLDTNISLQRLRSAGYRLGILSNVDDALLRGTLRHLTVDFDLLVTAQQVGSYKPAPGHFEVARRRIGDARWLHAAQSYFHDVVPARALGVPVAWINRHGDAPSGEARPDREFRNLVGLADWLAPDRSQTLSR